MSVEFSSNKYFKCILTPVGSGIAAGYGINRMERFYYQEVVEQYNLFAKAQPQSLAQRFLKQAKASPLLMFRVTVFSPILEEVALRGFFRQNQIEYNLKDLEYESLPVKIQRIATNSAVFSAIHFDPKICLKSNARIALPLFASGVIFNGLMESTENIAAPIIGHSLSNYLTIRKIRK